MTIGGVSSSAHLARSFQTPAFSALDKDGSGGITLQELSTAAPGGSADPTSAARAKKLFEAMDADKNGSVSSGEKSAFDKKLEAQVSAIQFATQLLGSSKAAADAGLLAADSDGNGSVSLEELSSSKAAQGSSSKAVSDLFAAVDSDSDGAITAAESKSFLESVKQAVAGGAGADDDGGPPPDSVGEDESQAKATTNVLSTATKAYATSSQSDLLSLLTTMLDKAA